MRWFVTIAVSLLLVAAGLTARVTAQDGSLTALLPSAEEIGPDFVVADDRARTLDEQANGFSDAGHAARLLADWQWQENAFQLAERAGETSVEISLTRFADAEAASQAMTFFLEDRAALLGQQEVRNLSPIGDEARAINGFIEGGFDSTLYARSGPLLIRVSALSPSGSPAVSPEQIAQGIIDRASGLSQPALTNLPIAEYLPETVPLSATDCSWVDDDGALDLPAFVERFDGVPDAAAALQALGWQEGAFRQFGCDDPPAGGVGWVTMGVLHFADPQAAADAVSFFAESRAAVTSLQSAPALDLGERAAALAGPAVNGAEYTLYLSQGPFLFRVTGVAPQGDPRPDVEAIATALYERSLGNPAVASPTAVPTTSPTIIVTPVPTIAPAAQATQLPTRAPIPTAAPLPSPALAPPTAVPTAVPTATPVPTSAPTAIPTETPVPTLVPVTVPTAAPPTATTGPQPTPTPRVIRPPTPDAGG